MNCLEQNPCPKAIKKLFFLSLIKRSKSFYCLIAENFNTFADYNLFSSLLLIKLPYASVNS